MTHCLCYRSIVEALAFPGYEQGKVGRRSYCLLLDEMIQLEKIRQDFRYAILFFGFGAGFAAFELTTSSERPKSRCAIGPSLAKVSAVVPSFSL